MTDYISRHLEGVALFTAIQELKGPYPNGVDVSVGDYHAIKKVVYFISLQSAARRNAIESTLRSELPDYPAIIHDRLDEQIEIVMAPDLEAMLSLEPDYALIEPNSRYFGLRAFRAASPFDSCISNKNGIVTPSLNLSIAIADHGNTIIGTRLYQVWIVDQMKSGAPGRFHSRVMQVLNSYLRNQSPAYLP